MNPGEQDITIPQVPEHGYDLYLPISDQLEGLNTLSLPPEITLQIQTLANDRFQPDSLLHRSAVAHAIHRACRNQKISPPEYKLTVEGYYSYEDAPRHQARRKQVLRLTEQHLGTLQTSKALVIELAAGTGTFGDELRLKMNELKQKLNSKFPEVQYSPSDVAQISLQKLLEKDHQPVETSITQLPYASNSVDVLYAGELIEHLTYPVFGQMLKEVNRVLKDGGLLIVTTPNYFSLPARNDLNAGLKPLVFDETRDPWASEHLTPFTKKSLTQSLRNEGLEIHTVSTNQVTWKISAGVPSVQELVESLDDTHSSADSESLGDSIIVSARKTPRS